MTRTYISTRDLTTLARERARIAALVARKPTTVVVTRMAGDGLTAAKTLAQIASFTGSISEGKPAANTERTTQTDGYIATSLVIRLTALRGNDAVDGISGNAVTLRRDDHITTTDGDDGFTRNFIVSAVQEFRGHVEAELAARS